MKTLIAAVLNADMAETIANVMTHTGKMVCTIEESIHAPGLWKVYAEGSMTKRAHNQAITECNRIESGYKAAMRLIKRQSAA